ncbi:hypothetical protein MUN81_04455 [Hymenobacter sp. 5317J-9]|uniref:hypothetical protein n=1 Tax=Hymenobacter sp. 5317J-9 TaxID=2932250 RepID=UPI001FD68ACC|nr:hypothetical protein [Hymenobacter sp. 5317J-9]UOQ98746.1 hypothetical protein MUN81_04455 [Hymenobacter sp. 5317J-9]
MKRVFLLAPLVLFLALVGCKKIDQLLTFTVDTSQSVVIPGLPGSTQLPAPVTVTTNSAASFQNNKTTKDKVKDVYLEQMVLTITDPSGANFDFLDKLDVYINTPNVNNKILLASISSVPQGTNIIKLTPTTARLDEYLKAETYELTVDSRSNRFSASNFTVKADSRFKVTANPL